jgi:hypothetical protein
MPASILRRVATVERCGDLLEASRFMESPEADVLDIEQTLSAASDSFLFT